MGRDIDLNNKMIESPQMKQMDKHLINIKYKTKIKRKVKINYHESSQCDHDYDESMKGKSKAKLYEKCNKTIDDTMKKFKIRKYNKNDYKCERLNPRRSVRIRNNQLSENFISQTKKRAMVIHTDTDTDKHLKNVKHDENKSIIMQQNNNNAIIDFNKYYTKNGNIFSCDWPQCDYKTKDKRILKDHIRSHCGIKRYKCSHPECERAFTKNTTLKNHMNYFHEKIPKTPIECPYDDCKHILY